MRKRPDDPGNRRLCLAIRQRVSVSENPCYQEPCPLCWQDKKASRRRSKKDSFTQQEVQYFRIRQMIDWGTRSDWWLAQGLLLETPGFEQKHIAPDGSNQYYIRQELNRSKGRTCSIPITPRRRRVRETFRAILLREQANWDGKESGTVYNLRSFRRIYDHAPGTYDGMIPLTLEIDFYP